jgi:hypothetical protein
VQKLLKGLSREGQDALALVCGLEQRLGPKVLEQVRQNSFHYPYPNPGKKPDSVPELADAIRMNANEPGGIDTEEGRPWLNCRFADQLALSIAFGGYDPEVEKAKKQLRMVRQASKAFVLLVEEIYGLYCEQRKFGFGTVD